MGPRLQRMIRDDSWSWSDIGRAMTLAGVLYESGKPWTGTLLMVKAAQARKQIRDRADRLPPSEASASQMPAGVKVLVSPAESTMNPAPLPRQSWLDPAPDIEKPTFALASFAPGEFVQPQPAPVEPSQSKAPRPRPRVEADEILRRLQGGPISPDEKD